MEMEEKDLKSVRVYRIGPYEHEHQIKMMAVFLELNIYVHFLISSLDGQEKLVEVWSVNECSPMFFEGIKDNQFGIKNWARPRSVGQYELNDILDWVKEFITRENGRIDYTRQMECIFNNRHDATFTMRVRNFNRLDQLTSFGLWWGESEVVHDSKFNVWRETGRAYMCDADVTSFLPKEIITKLKNEADRRGVTIGDFVASGQELANAMKRVVKITHQYGSSEQSEACYDHYAFQPQNKK